MSLILAALLIFQDPPLTKGAIDKAARTAETIGDAEIQLLNHESGRNRSVTINGKGICTIRRSYPFPIVEGETEEIEVLREKIPAGTLLPLFRAIGEPDILPMHGAPVENPRYTLRCIIPGAGRFETLQPDVLDPKVQVGERIRELVRSIRAAAGTAFATQRAAEERFLTTAKLEQLIEEGGIKVTIEANSIQGLFGGQAVRVTQAGDVRGIRLPVQEASGAGGPPRRFAAQVRPRAIREILAECIKQKTWDIRRTRAYEQIDEQRPAIQFTVDVDGTLYRKSIWLWDGEAQSKPEFQSLIRWILNLGTE